MVTLPMILNDPNHRTRIHCFWF